MRDRFDAFTLIELLVVVAIIAILAAIAVPNFLEAQVRAKVSRVQTDLRTIATGLEAYHLDNNAYPLNDGDFNVIPIPLTTPIAYLFNARMVDPFCEREMDMGGHGDLVRFYTYQKIVGREECENDIGIGHAPPIEAVDTPAYNAGALRKYGRWRLVSFGPDKKYADEALADSDPVLKGCDIAYDPTNGTVSFGNILRTQKSASGKIEQ